MDRVADADRGQVIVVFGAPHGKPVASPWQATPACAGSTTKCA